MSVEISNRVERRFYQILLLLSDFLFLYVSVLLAQYFRFGVVDYSLIGTPTFLIHFFCVFLGFYIFDLYEPFYWRTKLFSPIRISVALLIIILFMSFYIYLSTSVVQGLLGRGVLLGSTLILGFFSAISRFIMEKSIIGKYDKKNWLFICSESLFEAFKNENKNKTVTGSHEWIDIQSVKNVGNQVQDALTKTWYAVVVESGASVALDTHLLDYRIRGKTIMSFQRFFEVYWLKIPVKALDYSWFIFSDGFLILESRITRRIKRLVDIFLSLLLLVLSFPILILSWIIIRIESPGNPIYKQTRVGEGGSHFTILKFRSMSMDAEKSGAQWAQKNDMRVTRFGKFIRKTRIDEIPQAFNILKGDMSFIGPRPERPEFVEDLKTHIPFFELRNLVKPGLTGWAQVNYPYGASIEDAQHKLEYDLFYIKNLSLKMDLSIIFKTISVVLFGKGR